MALDLQEDSELERLQLLLAKLKLTIGEARPALDQLRQSEKHGLWQLRIKDAPDSSSFASDQIKELQLEISALEGEAASLAAEAEIEELTGSAPQAAPSTPSS